MRTPQARILNEDLTSENTEQSSMYNTISRGLLPMVENAMQSVEPHGMMPMRVSRLRIGASGSSTSTLLAALTRRMRALAISLKVPSPPTAITPSTEDRSTCCFLGGGEKHNELSSQNQHGGVTVNGYAASHYSWNPFNPSPTGGRVGADVRICPQPRIGMVLLNSQKIADS